jgi:hypothetical protein
MFVIVTEILDEVHCCRLETHYISEVGCFFHQGERRKGSNYSVGPFSLSLFLMVLPEQVLIPLKPEEGSRSSLRNVTF